MKKINNSMLFLIILILISNSIHSQQVNYDLIQTVGIIKKQDLSIKRQLQNSIAVKAIQKGEKAGAFTNVSYRYAPTVKVIPGLSNQLNMYKDGILELKGTNVFVPHPDSIYVDEDPNSDLVLKAQPLNENQMILVRPSLSRVFDDIQIQNQEVKLTLANTVECAVANPTASGSGDDYAVNFTFDSLKIEHDSLTKITLNGEVKLTNPRIEGKFSKNNGYRLIFKAAEQVDMTILANATFKNEFRKLLWGTEIPVKDLGKCDLGVFLLINAKGEISLNVEIHQSFNMALGVHGSTCWYVPTSLKNSSEIEQSCDVSCDIKSKMKVFAGLQCTAKLKIKSYNALDLYVNGGMEGTVETDNYNLSADVGLRLKSGGKAFSKSFTLLDKYYSLWKYQTPDFAGYEMKIYEACAYGDFVAGEIFKTKNNTLQPHTGNLLLIVKHPDNSINQYTTSTNEKGIFLAKNVLLKKGDKVSIKLPGVNNPSSSVDATIPFKSIGLMAADYYAGIASGMVAASKSEWYKMATQQSSSQNTTQQSVIKNSINQNRGVKYSNLSKNEVINKLNEFKNNTINYMGKIEFITKNEHVAVYKGTSPGTTVKNKEQSKPTKNESLKNIGNVQSGLGFFNITGLNFAPNQMVKARIELEGFTIESDWIETDGIIVSDIEYENIQFNSGVKGEKISADNSFVIVSALRSETAPSGNVKMVKGVDIPHAALISTELATDFPEAKKACVFFNNSVTLKPVEGYTGTSTASVGAWSKSIPYLSPVDVINPRKNGKHPFELVSYLYKNSELGYKLFIDECGACNTTNALNQIQKSPESNSGLNIGKEVNPVKQVPKINQNKGNIPAK